MNKEVSRVLKEKGYNVVRLPKADIESLDLLVKEESGLSSLGAKFELLFEPAVSVAPPVLVDVADIQGQDIIQFNGSLGLAFLNSFSGFSESLEANLKTKLEASNNARVSFSFKDIKEEKVNLLDLDNFLSGAIPVEGQFRTYSKKLRKSELFIITSVLKSNSISVSINKDNGQSVGLDVEAADTVNANLDLNRNISQEVEVFSVANSAPLTFAFKAVKIIYDNKKWYQFWKKDEISFTIKNEVGADLLGEEDYPVIELDEEVAHIG